MMAQQVMHLVAGENSTTEPLVCLDFGLQIRKKKNHLELLYLFCDQDIFCPNHH